LNRLQDCRYIAGIKSSDNKKAGPFLTLPLEIPVAQFITTIYRLIHVQNNSNPNILKNAKVIVKITFSL
jgi:hypothetical protein